MEPLCRLRGWLRRCETVAHYTLLNQACVRVCLKHLSNIKESGYFLVRDCDKLAGAFGLRDMFLKESHGIVGDETGVIWYVLFNTENHSHTLFPNHTGKTPTPLPPQPSA